MVCWLAAGFLENEFNVKPLVALATPFVKLADKFVGEKCAMKVCTFDDDDHHDSPFWPS
jgi:hypothetical protein